MKKLVTFLTAFLLCTCLFLPVTAQAEEIEVLRGEEAEEEIMLAGTEEVYSLQGELSGTMDYLRILDTKEENYAMYQGMEPREDGSGGKLLLSERGNKGWNLSVRLRVKGVRIGTGTVSIKDAVMTDESGEWILGVELPEITVKVLPNPLVVNFYGTAGNAGWYVSPVEVDISDKDAAWIWYSLDGGEKKEYTESFTIGDGSWTVTASSDDGFGYKKEETRSVSVDTVKPALSASVEKLDWQAGDIALTAGWTDRTSGLELTGQAFSEDRENSGGMEYTASCVEEKELTVTQDGIWYLHLYGKDVAGNESEKVYGPYKKDSVAPQIEFKNLYEGCLAEESVLPQLLITDDRSGIKKITYILDGRNWSLSEIKEKGKHTLTVTAEDLAGNKTTETVNFSVYHRITVTADAGDTRYTHTASFSALVAYRGKPLKGVVAEFFVNGESIGVQRTFRDGTAQLFWPVWLSPQEAELSVRVAQDDKNFLLAGENTDAFTVKPEQAWLIYTGDYAVRKGEPLHLRFETGEFLDYRHGDLTRAELSVTMYFIEEDGSRTPVEEILLTPNEWGYMGYKFYGETGLYEMVAGFTENSCYTAPGITLHPAVYEIDASLSLEGGSLIVDLPQAGFYLKAGLTFLPPDIDAEVRVTLPGTGITLTEHKLEGYSLDTGGLVLYGSAVNPKNRNVYSYEIKTEFSFGFLLTGTQTSIWKGADREGTPVHTYTWRLEDMIQGLQEEEAEAAGDTAAEE